MVLVGADIKTMAYIRSEAEFKRARVRGFWDVIGSLLTGGRTHLLSFNEVVKSSSYQQMVDRGLQDVPLKAIAGSVGRSREYTRRLLPCLGGENDKERWRKVYTLVTTGSGIRPVELYKVGQDYFVKDGHHRVSVAKYLGWESIQAQVIEGPVWVPALATPGDPVSLSSCVME
jgi:hypothetical protein